MRKVYGKDLVVGTYLKRPRPFENNYWQVAKELPDRFMVYANGDKNSEWPIMKLSSTVEFEMYDEDEFFLHSLIN